METTYLKTFKPRRPNVLGNQNLIWVELDEIFFNGVRNVPSDAVVESKPENSNNLLENEYY